MGQDPLLTPEHEKQLLALLQRGDRGALGELLSAYQHRIYHVCLRMVSSADDAAELAQDTLLRAVQHVDSFKGDAKFSTWLTRIAMNLSISHLRKAKLRNAVSLDHQHAATNGEAQPLRDLIHQNHEPSPHSRVENSEQLDRLAGAMDAIDPALRSVILLRDLQGMDYQQIAEVLSVPVGTVKSRLFRARLALRKVMEAPSPVTNPTRTTEVADG
ncbi:MAG: sigma-70 family RNA polymerase sigma factor [Phycisphaeraceae bacterium]